MRDTYTPTRPQQVYRAVLPLVVPEGSHAGAVLADAYDAIIEKWLDGVCIAVTGSSVEVVDGKWSDDRTWTTEMLSFTFTSITSTEEDPRSALRVVYRVPGGTTGWTYNIGLFLDERGLPNIDVQTFCAEWSAEYGAVRRELPECLKPLLRAGMIGDVVPLEPKAKATETFDDVRAMLNAAENLDRRLPIIAISEPFALDPDGLAERLYGVAHVFALSTGASWTLTNIVGDQWSVYGGAIRTYRTPYLPSRQDKRAHPLALYASIMQRGVEQFTLNFIDNAFRNASTDADRFPHHDFLALREHLLKERAAPRPTVASEGKSALPMDAPDVAAEPSPAEPAEEAAERSIEAERRKNVDQEHEVLVETNLQLRARITELEAQLAQAQATSEQTENDYFALVADFDEYRKIHAEDAVSFGDLLKTAEQLPLSADLKAMVIALQRLATGMHGVVQDVRSISTELDELRERNYALQAKQSSTAPVDAVQRPIPRDIRPETVSDYVREHLSDKVVLHPRALDALKGTPFENPRLVYDALELLGNEYRGMRLRGETEKEAFEQFNQRSRELGLTYSGSISPTELPKFHQHYHVQYDGKERFLEKHLRNGGNTADPKRCFRCYFFFDEVKQVVVVGWLPGHLPNSMT